MLCALLLSLLCWLPLASHALPDAAAAPAAAAPAAPAPALAASGATAHPVEGPSFAPMAFALLIVLGLVGAAAWAMRRVGLAPRAGGARALRLVGQLSLGPRERVVIVEVADRWLLLGVASGSISRLGSVPKGETGGAPAAPPNFGSLVERLRGGGA
jgi:flagellar protein FliO/FliZ